jgi:two-component system cell cycle response regulator
MADPRGVRLLQQRAHRHPAQVDRAPQPTPDHAAATILVCDDDPSLRELVRAVLGPRYRFIEAADGTEALVAARELSPDLIVLDVMLPGISGIEVLETIRNDEQLKDLLVVVITAWSHAELEARVAGADRFVSKPFDPDDLSSAVEELLG